jgi:hypothetical protein
MTRLDPTHLERLAVAANGNRALGLWAKGDNG